MFLKGVKNYTFHISKHLIGSGQRKSDGIAFRKRGLTLTYNIMNRSNLRYLMAPITNYAGVCPSTSRPTSHHYHTTRTREIWQKSPLFRSCCPFVPSQSAVRNEVRNGKESCNLLCRYSTYECAYIHMYINMYNTEQQLHIQYFDREFVVELHERDTTTIFTVPVLGLAQRQRLAKRCQMGKYKSA